MSYLINNQQKLNDIIFADRNKEYGAYAIRSTYGNTILKSISFMLIGVGIVSSIAFFLSSKNQPDADLSGQTFINDTVYVIPFNAEEKQKEETTEKPEEQAKAKENTKLSENTNIAVVDSTLGRTTITTTVVSVVSSQTTSGVETPGVASAGSVSTGGGLPGADSSSQVSQPYEVDSAPEFEGGLSALYRFVGQHLKYPNWASGEGKEGTVFVKFVVDENGKVGALSLLNSVGYGMDDEALRVVSLIPKFKSPAKVRGVPVKVYYQLPIRFRFKY